MADAGVTGAGSVDAVGVAASDINGTETKASFDYFIYRPVEHESDRYDI